MDVKGGFQVNGISAVTVGGTGTARKFFPFVPGPSIGTSNTTPSSTSRRGQVNFPGNSRLNGQLFRVDICGSVYVDPAIACPTVTVELLAQTQNSPSNLGNPVYTILASTGAVTTTGLALIDEPFRITYEGNGSTESGVVQGQQYAQYNNVNVNSTPKAGTNALSGIDFSADVPFGLVVAVTFSISGSANLATLTQFSLSA